MKRFGRAVIWTLVFTAVALPAPGDSELVLIDGRVLRGADVRRDRGTYVLTLEDGSEIALPEELVERVRLIAKGEPNREVTPEGLRVAEPEQLAGMPAPEGPTGLRSEGPETLAGGEVIPPSRSEQLEVLGERAEFQKDIVDSHWEPSSDWEMNPEKNNNFAPSTWSEGVIDPSWQPESAFDSGKDVMKHSRSTWQAGVVDSSWAPTDGFKNSIGRR